MPVFLCDNSYVVKSMNKSAKRLVGDMSAFYNFSGYDEPGYVLPTGRVFNLVTKQKYWQKPTYKTMRLALEDLKEALRIRKITKIAMPKIGCGLDRLEWETVRRMIQYIFADTDVEILVCWQ